MPHVETMCRHPAHRLMMKQKRFSSTMKVINELAMNSQQAYTYTVAIEGHTQGEYPTIADNTNIMRVTALSTLHFNLYVGNINSSSK